MQIVSATIEVPGPDHRVFDRASQLGGQAHTIQPAVAPDLTGGTLFLRNLVCHRLTQEAP